MLSWETDQNSICDIIRGQRSSLKIVLKIQDDLDMFNDFFDYHSHMVGSENIFIFDNCSTHEGLLSRYRDLGSRANIFSFNGFHNDLHSAHRFKALYDALRASSSYYTFLDSDERLCLIESGQWFNDNRLVTYLESLECCSIPGIWLSNANGSKEIFELTVTGHELKHGINWGKPIFHADEPVEGYINHNIQAIKHIRGGLKIRQIFVLHLNRLSAKQRIEANIRKLVARGFVPKQATAEDVISARQPSYKDQNIAFYVDEVATLYNSPPLPATRLAPGQLLFSPSGTIEFYSHKEKEELKYFIEKSLISIQFSSNTNTIELALPEEKIHHNYKGHIDSHANGIINGWAVDSSGNPCYIRLLVNGVEHSLVHTDLERPDLKRLEISNGLGGFSYSMKNAFPHGKYAVQLLFPNGSPISGGLFSL